MIIGAFLMKNGFGGFHVGALVRSEDQELFACHFADHHNFQFHRALPDQKIAWNPCPIAELRMGILRDMFIAISQHPSRDTIPYSFHSSGLRFSSEGEWLSTGEPGEGVTCASFLMAVFKSCSVPFLLESTWPPPTEREEKLRKAHAVMHLAAVASPEHAQAAETAPFCARFKPEEVAVGVGLMHPPDGMSYDVILPHANDARTVIEGIDPEEA